MKKVIFIFFPFSRLAVLLKRLVPFVTMSVSTFLDLDSFDFALFGKTDKYIILKRLLKF